jgi:flagellum-specific peptidoglycan hydrolase FlgJ
MMNATTGPAIFAPVDEGSAPAVAEHWPIHADIFATTGEASADHFSAAEHAAAFPSGLTLVRVAAAEGSGQEYWDPNDTGVPLYDTGSAMRAKKLSESFTVGEVASSGGRADDRARISVELVKCLQAIRICAGHPTKVLSGYRSWSRNVAVYQNAGKAPARSRHCSGQAADISIAGLSGLQIAKLAVDAYGDGLGIGVGKTFAHIDVRGAWTLWTYDGVDSAARSELETHRAQRRSGKSSCSCANCGGKSGTSKPVAGIPAHVVEFVRTYRPHAEASEARNRVPWLVTLGQAALESAWGKSTCGNNMFGIKATPKVPEWQRKLCTTREVHTTNTVRYPEVTSVTPRPDGKFDYVVKDWFRAFASPTESFDAHGQVLQARRYAKAFDHTDDAYAFAREVAAGGYATAPNYASALTGVMKLLEKVP